jgi:hypothetical protein
MDRTICSSITARNRNQSLDDLRNALADRAAELAVALLGQPNRKLSTRAELRFGNRGSLAVVIAGTRAGSFYDHEAGTGGDLLDLIHHVRDGCGFIEALRVAREFVGHDAIALERRAAPKPKPDKDDEAVERLRIARFLWSQRRPISGTPGERYLREARKYSGTIWPTIAYLPAHGDHQHAVIAAFGTPEETEPGVLAMRDDAVVGVHLIRLLPDGSDRDRAHPKGKISIGKCPGTPIVVSPFHDSNNALVIAEGIEDALSAHDAMGIAAWAAGGASRMPALADTVPDYVDAINVLEDDNPAGRENTTKLIERLQERFPNVEVRRIPAFVDGGER